MAINQSKERSLSASIGRDPLTHTNHPYSVRLNFVGSKDSAHKVVGKVHLISCLEDGDVSTIRLLCELLKRDKALEQIVNKMLARALEAGRQIENRRRHGYWQ